MKTVFVGAGQGCKAVLELVVQHRLATLSLDILGVVDRKPDAPGMRFARQQGWPTFTSLDDGLAAQGLELVIELTGIDGVRDEIFQRVPHHVRVMDHSLARVFWDLDEVVQHLREELEEKTRREAEIRADRRRLQEILDSLPDAVMVVNSRERIERVNRRFAVATGRSTQDVLGQPCSETICTMELRERCRELACPHHSVVATGRPMTTIQTSGCLGWGSTQGEESYFEVTASPILEPDGDTSVVITSREVTDQILLKRETEESARRFDQILSAVHGLITIKDLGGRYQLVNDAASQFFGVAAEQMYGKTAIEVFEPAVARVMTEGDAALLEQRRHLSREEVLVVGDEERILLTERFMLNDYRGEPVGICCVSNDVTEARRLQTELLQSEKHAAVGKLAAGVAHEINNPLTGILTFAEDLLETFPEGEAAHEDLQVILRETLRCRRIVRDLLDFSRQKRPIRQRTSVATVIRKALNLVQNQASFHDIRFNMELGADDYRIKADPGQLQQVILNLIINARDAMDGKGEIAVRVSAAAGGHGAVVEVGDHGCGIPQEDLTRIFEPFYSTKGDQGMGLGLAVVRKIVEQHGGKIDVQSREGEGATFRISLPLARVREQELRR